jgi:hypothetical protein
MQAQLATSDIDPRAVNPARELRSGVSWGVIALFT